MDVLELLSILEQTPTWLRAGLALVADDQAFAAPWPRAWSLAESLAHLRASDAILAPRVFHVLVRDQPPLIGFDERAWAAMAASGGLSLTAQIDLFAGGRAELLGVLRALDGAAWSRHGIHETRGVLTLQQIVADLAEHEREHHTQWDASLRALTSATPAASPVARATPKLRRPARRRPY